MKYYPEHSKIRVELAKREFWDFCRLMDPDFYQDDRHHLKTLCHYLQGVVERTLDKPNLIIQMPPRHGKSRTLTNLSAWALGKNQQERIITASYGDDLAQDFSRFTRDIISEQKNLPDQTVYSDVFPGVSIKRGDSAFHKWALDGQFFNYKGTGVGGSITGRGGSLLVVDDPVKDAEVAYNPNALDKIWLWYTGTFMSRGEEGSRQIVCMTPWAKGDLAFRLLEAEPEQWSVLSLPACTGGEMLCPDLLSKESYNRIKRTGDDAIVRANYDLERIDIQGRLYSGFKTYDNLPDDTEENLGYTDTADEGSDFLCSIMARKKGLFYYVTDILYTQEPQEITEPALVKMIKANETRNMMIESNNGGRAFSRNIIRLLNESVVKCSVEWFHQSKNKRARIMTNASTVQEYVLFPSDWIHRWPKFYGDLINYQKEGKNAHDDAPDALTGMIEKQKHVTKAVQISWG